jgi:hypothetical protein
MDMLGLHWKFTSPPAYTTPIPSLYHSNNIRPDNNKYKTQTYKLEREVKNRVDWQKSINEPKVHVGL